MKQITENDRALERAQLFVKEHNIPHLLDEVRHLIHSVQGLSSLWGCSYCKYDGIHYNQVAEHEFLRHFSPKRTSRLVRDEDEEESEFIFLDKPTFDAFSAAYCARTPTWEEVGWYKISPYRDSVRGCDMGMTIDLEKVCDYEVEQYGLGQ